MRSRWFVLVVIFAATLGTLHSGPDDATVNVVASSSAGDRLARLSQNGGVFLTQRAACLIATHFRC